MFQLPSCFRVKHKILKQWLLTAGIITLVPFTTATEAYSANLGRINVISTVNQPLKAEIELNGVSKEDLNKVQVKLADDDAYSAAGIKNPGIKDAKVQVKTKPNGKAYVEIQSAQPVDKEFLNLMVDVKGVNGNPQTRDYTVMLDPEQKNVEGLALSKRRAIERKANAQTPTNRNVRVKSGDNLGEIATRIKPKNISVDQMLVMLYNANPNAFWGNNMNNLKSGVILKVPRNSVPSRAEASRIVEVHADDWHGYRSKVANSVERGKESQKPAPKESATNGQITPKVTDSKPKANGDVLILSDEKSQNSANKDLQTRLQELEEQATIKEKALKESNDRVMELEKNLAEMKKLLTIQNDSMANAQRNAEKAVENKKPVENQPLTPKPIEQKVTLQPKAEEPKHPAPVNHDDFWSNPAYLGAIIASLLGIGGLIIFLRKKRQEREEEERQTRLDRMSQANVPNQQDEPMPDPRPATDFAKTLNEANNKAEIETPPLDILEQVDLLLRDGKDQEAIDLLEKGIAKTPYRNDLHLKLLEILMERRDTDNFEREARSLKNLLNDDEHDAWQKTKIMGLKIDPFNPLYLDDVQDDFNQSQEEHLEATQSIGGSDDFVDLDGDDIPDLTQVEEEPKPVSFTKTDEEPIQQQQPAPDFDLDSDEALELPDDDLMLTSELDLSSIKEPSKNDTSLEESGESISSLDQLLSGKDVDDSNIDDALEALEKDQGIDIPGFDELGLDDDPKPTVKEPAKPTETEEKFDSSFDELKHILDPSTIDQPGISAISVDAWKNGIEEAEAEQSNQKPNFTKNDVDDMGFDAVDNLDDDITPVSNLIKPESSESKLLDDEEIPDFVLDDLDDAPKAKTTPANPDLEINSTVGSDVDFAADFELAEESIKYGDIDGAKQLLNDIIKNGSTDAELKRKAEELLKTI